MVHRNDVERYPGSLADLASDVADLRYDALAGFLHSLGAKLSADGDADAGQGRPRLAAALRTASEGVALAAAEIEQAWAICASRM